MIGHYGIASLIGHVVKMGGRGKDVGSLFQHHDCGGVWQLYDSWIIGTSIGRHGYINSQYIKYPPPTEQHTAMVSIFQFFVPHTQEAFTRMKDDLYTTQKIMWLSKRGLSASFKHSPSWLKIGFRNIFGEITPFCGLPLAVGIKYDPHLHLKFKCSGFHHPERTRKANKMWPPPHLNY